MIATLRASLVAQFPAGNLAFSTRRQPTRNGSTRCRARAFGSLLNQGFHPNQAQLPGGKTPDLDTSGGLPCLPSFLPLSPRRLTRRRERGEAPPVPAGSCGHRSSWLPRDLREPDPGFYSSGGELDLQALYLSPSLHQILGRKSCKHE